MTELGLEWREMHPDERAYVLSSWIKSFSGTSPDAKAYRLAGQGARFAHDYVPVLRAIADRSHITVACFADEPEQMVGWMAVEGDVLHYVCTKKRFRRLGVATWMLSAFREMPVVYTHRTNDGDRFLRPPMNWNYRRWRIWPAEEAA